MIPSGSQLSETRRRPTAEEGVRVDGSTIPAVLAEVQVELAELVAWLTETPELD